MIKLRHDMKSETREMLRGGEGNVTITHLFTKEEMQSRSRLCARLIIPPGASIGMHAHDHEEELYYIIGGRCEINDSGKTVELGPGDAVLTGGGASHSIKCLSHNACELLAFIAAIPEEQKDASAS